MTGEVIKSFLVGLGFEVDDKTLTKFNKAIVSASLRVTALYGAVKAAAAGIAFAISKISESFEDLGYEYKILAPALNKAIILRQEMLRAYSAAGVNLNQVVVSAARFNLSLTKTKYAFDALYKSVAARFFPLLTKMSDSFRKKIYDNMEKIQKALEKFVNFIFKAFEVATLLGERVWAILSRIFDFFVNLHRVTQGWSTIILGILAAWNLLNLSFLATPLGMVLGGLLAILALWDDFQVWKEGGKSLFDWSSAIPVIEAVSSTLSSLWGILDAIGGVIAGLILAFQRLFEGNFDGFFFHLKGAAEEVLNIFSSLWGVITGIGDSLSSVGGFVGDLFNGESSFQSSGEGGVLRPRPLTAPGGNSNSQTNQSVNQKTDIYVQGAANAEATGRAISFEQNRVNANMVRYMKEPTIP